MLTTLRVAAKSPGEHDAEQGGQARTHGSTGINATKALRGGTWIGNLERLAITGSIICGYPEAIAVIVAITGLGRFPELKANLDVSERIVIGTIASYLWAAGMGLAVLAVR